MFGKKKGKAWYCKAQKAYRKDKLPAPYSSLFDYYTIMDKKHLSGGRGHMDFFSIAKSDGRLGARVEDLRSVLPQALLDNFNAAYDKYISLGSLGDTLEYDESAIDAFLELDEYVFERYDLLEELLKTQIAKMIENRII